MIKDTSAQDQLVSVPKKSPWRLGVLVGSVLAGVLVITWVIFQFGDTTPSINSSRLRIAEVKTGNLTRDVAITGRVVAGFSPMLYAPASGTVSFHVRAGDEVSQNQILATIHSPELNNQLMQEQAILERLDIGVKRQTIETQKKNLQARKELEEARIKLTGAKRELQRNESAWSKGVVNEVDLQKAKDEYTSAKIIYAHAQEAADLDLVAWKFEQEVKELELKQQELLVAELKRVIDALEIRSPIDGMVGNLMVEEKTVVAENASVLNVVDLSQLEIEAQIPELYADALSPGLSAEVRMGDYRVAARLASISPEVNEGSVSARIRFDEELPQPLRQNQRLQTRVLLDERENTLVLAKGPFMDDGAGKIAYLVRDDVAERITIKTGIASINEVEILEGLKAGDQVVISSLDQFNNADRVRLN